MYSPFLSQVVMKVLSSITLKETAKEVVDGIEEELAYRDSTLYTGFVSVQTITLRG